MNGATLFARFALPPNAAGYCGPDDTTLLEELLRAQGEGLDELRHTAEAFAGAWPYLELIGGTNGLDPLDPLVVEAYWLGNHLLDRIDMLTWGNALQHRFQPRAGGGFESIASALLAGGSPSHAFHVFCVYPWVGLLRSGIPGPALRVLDRCRIRTGCAVGVEGHHTIVESRHLEWTGRDLRLGAPRIEGALTASDPHLEIATGDLVALHWDHICQVISPQQLARTRALEEQHIALANRQVGWDGLVEA